MQQEITIVGQIKRTTQIFDAGESAAGIAALVEAEMGLESGKYSRIRIDIVPGQSTVIFEELLPEVNDGG